VLNNNPCPEEKPESIRQRKLANPIIELGEAARYADRGKNDEAIEIIEKLVASGIQTPEILFALGEVYEAANLNPKAKENYNKAIKISSQVVVAAQAGLARIEDALGDGVAANSLRQESIKKFAALADTERSRELGLKVDGLAQGKDKFLFLSAKNICGNCTCDDGRPGRNFFGTCLPCNG
jgi:tetratricopeptide (TPR) repeat protein